MPYISSLASSAIKDTYYLRSRYNTNQDINGSTWNQRAWTLQENAFSTRRLYFTQNAISFSCDLDLHVMDGTAASAYGIETAEWSLLFANDKSDYHTEWQALTKQYSQRQLSYPEDRLPAISAWAQLLGQRLEERYLAGLWEGDLLRGLLWTCEAIYPTQSLTKRMKFALKEKFVAPSWSWASQTERICYKHWSEGKTNYKILNIEVSPIGSNRFGRLKSGHIVISGAIWPIPVAPIYKNLGCFRSAFDKTSWVEYFLDWWDERMDVADGQTIEHGVVQDKKLLPLTRCPSPEHTGLCTCGLIVLSTGADGEYWRVGTFTIEPDLGHVELSNFDCKRTTIKIV